jgi:hypothetical protein
MLVAHSCYPNYSGVRDEEDHGSGPAGKIVCQIPSWKNPSQKSAGGVAQGEGPEFKPQYCKKKVDSTTKISKNSNYMCMYLCLYLYKRPTVAMCYASTDF